MLGHSRPRACDDSARSRRASARTACSRSPMPRTLVPPSRSGIRTARRPRCPATVSESRLAGSPPGRGNSSHDRDGGTSHRGANAQRPRHGHRRGGVSVGKPEVLDGIELTTVSVGNPHAVIRLDEPTRDDLVRLGPLIETHARFPDRTNVQLVRVDGRHDITVLVWERGAGETSASGSSAVAAAAVAVDRQWCDSPVTVHLPGGSLEVRIAEGRASLIGPAERVAWGSTIL